MISWESKGIDLGRYADRHSGYVKVHCPECDGGKHGKSDKSLSCNLETGAFKCHRCGFQGFATVVTDEEKEAWMRQQPWYRDYNKKKDEPKRDYARPPKPRSTSLAPDVIKYFATRHISEETLKRMHVTSGTDWMPAHKGHRAHDKNGNPIEGANCTTIHFNYYRDGELIATKLRSGDKMFRQAKAGCEQIAYNLDGIKNATDCYIVEGEIDALSLAEIGYTNVISVPDGGADKAMHWLVDYYETHFADKQTIYICVDNDTVGGGLCNELAKHFDPGTYVIVTDFGINPATNLPCKDANECLVSLGPDTLRLKLSQGKTVQPEGDVDPDSVAAEMDDIFENGLPKGLCVGFPELDRIFRVQKGRLIVVTGTPGSGKSHVLDMIAEKMNINYGWRWSEFSPEMKPLGQHATMIAQKFYGKPIDKEHISRDMYVRVRNRVTNAFHFIDPENYELDSILAIAKYQIRKYGCDGLILDPWNDLMHNGDGITKTDDINTALLKILTFAQRNDIAAFVMAHPTKQQRNKDGSYPETDLNDISGGAHFRNRADTGLVIQRHRKGDPDNPHDFDYTEIKNKKNRFENLGELGSAFFRYQVGVGRFHPFDPVTGVTQWDESNHLDEHAVQGIIPMDERTAAPASEANVAGFLAQAERMERELKPRNPLESDVAQSESRANSFAMPSQSNVSEDNDDLPFYNNDETPF